MSLSPVNPVARVEIRSATQVTVRQQQPPPPAPRIPLPLKLPSLLRALRIGAELRSARALPVLTVPCPTQNPTA
jgi:hypothetical protein